MTHEKPKYGVRPTSLAGFSLSPFSSTPSQGCNLSHYNGPLHFHTVSVAEKYKQLFRNLYERYYDEVTRYVLNMADSNRTVQDAEDIVHNAFEETYSSIGILAAMPEPARKNKIYQFVKKNIRRFHKVAKQRRYMQDVYNIGSDRLPDRGPPPDQQAIATEDLERFVAGTRDLKEDLRQALELRFIQGKTYQDIADIQGKSRSAIKMAFFRMRKQLKNTD